MPREGEGPDFIEALARGLAVIEALAAAPSPYSLSQISQVTGLARPTVRRILLTLESLGYVQQEKGNFTLTPRVLDLSLSQAGHKTLWEIAKPHMTKAVDEVNESCSIAQLDGADIIYVARVSVPKIVALSVRIGTRFPAAQTSLGLVLLASLSQDELGAALSAPSRSGIRPRWEPSRDELYAVLREVRAQGWAIADEYLAPGIRSVAAPIRDGDGTVVAAININCHAGETSLEKVRDEYLPVVIRAAGAISADIARSASLPHLER